MPVVRGHEELSAVLRVVIAVWPQRAPLNGRTAVRARAWLDPIDSRLRCAGPRHGDPRRNEWTPTDAARPFFLGDFPRVYPPQPRRAEQYRNQAHHADGAPTGLR